MARRRRWELDERGVGTGDAGAWRPLIDELATLSGQDDWVAEEPEAHLLPHLAAATANGPLAIRRSFVEDGGAFVVDLEWTGPTEPTRLDLRNALFGVVAPIAETVTVVHEPPESEGHVLEVMTGMRPGGVFATHGHPLQLRVAIGDRASSAGLE